MPTNIRGYRINGQDFETIESVNQNGQRIWVKFNPLNHPSPARVANILDIPSEVGWNIKTSHLETIDPSGIRHNYTGVGEAGSFVASSIPINLRKDPNAEAVFFIISPAGAQPPTNLTVGSDSQGNINLSVDQRAWIGYATSSGALHFL